MTFRLVSIPLDGATPIVLTTHPYFSLNAFWDPASPDSLDHTLHMPYLRRYMKMDNIEVPTGEIGVVKSQDKKRRLHDFTSPATLGDSINANSRPFCERSVLIGDTGPQQRFSLSIESPWNGENFQTLNCTLFSVRQPQESSKRLRILRRPERRVPKNDNIIAFAANDVQTIQNGGASTDTNYSFQVCGVGYSGGVSYPAGLAVKK
ncbi:MAG: hypothetical protein Q9199_002512 [Rusavskia elegans]